MQAHKPAGNEAHIPLNDFVRGTMSSLRDPTPFKMATATKRPCMKVEKNSLDLNCNHAIFSFCLISNSRRRCKVKSFSEQLVLQLGPDHRLLFLSSQASYFCCVSFHFGSRGLAEQKLKAFLGHSSSQIDTLVD